MQTMTPFICAAILFDLDGVLIDSTPCIARHWEEWAAEHGLDIDVVMQHAHGVPCAETMRTVAPELDIADEVRRFTAHEVADTDGVVAIEGAAKLLASLPNGAWAIVTSASRDLARARLTRAGLPIPETMVTVNDVTRGKPAPEPYLRGASLLGFSPEQCIVVEDAPAGVHAGRSAGMRVIGVGSTHALDVLMESGATVAVGRLSSLRVNRGAVDKLLHVDWAN